MFKWDLRFPNWRGRDLRDQRQRSNAARCNQTAHLPCLGCTRVQDVGRRQARLFLCVDPALAPTPGGVRGEVEQQRGRCASVQPAQSRDVGPVNQSEAGERKKRKARQRKVPLDGIARSVTAAASRLDLVSARPPVTAEVSRDRQHSADAGDEVERQQRLRREAKRNAAQCRAPARQQRADQQMAQLQGVAERVAGLDMGPVMDRLEQVARMASAERELVRDPKTGRAVGARVKAVQ